VTAIVFSLENFVNFVSFLKLSFNDFFTGGLWVTHGCLKISYKVILFSAGTNILVIRSLSSSVRFYVYSPMF